MWAKNLENDKPFVNLFTKFALCPGELHTLAHSAYGE